MGGAEAVVAGSGGDDEAVSQQGNRADAQEEPEAQELQLPRVCRRRQEEGFGCGAAVGRSLPLGTGTCPKEKKGVKG